MRIKQKRLVLTVSVSILIVFVASCTTLARERPIRAVSASSSFNFENKTVTLNNGIEMPLLGLGTYLLSPQETEASVYYALTNGYRLIDTANAYMNERAVGRGIHRSGVPREEIFVVTKLWPTDYEDVERAINDTLARLNLEYVDLLFLHQPYGNIIDGYRGIEAAVGQGKVRAIGLSNFFERRFDEIISIATIPPAVLQIESNPYVHQAVMREHIRPYGIVLNSWFPLGGRISENNSTQTRLFNEEIIVKLAEAYGKSPAQIILRWHLQIENVAIPGSRTPAHILQNISIFDFELTAEDMQMLSTLDTGTPSFDFSNVDENAAFAMLRASWDFNDQE